MKSLLLAGAMMIATGTCVFAQGGYWVVGNRATNKCDIVTSNPIIIGALKQLVGAKQILFGTDHPFGNSAPMAQAMSTVGLTAEEMRGVNRENALRIFSKYR